MNQIAIIKEGRVAVIDPPPITKVDAVRNDAMVQAAKRLKDWPTLEVAVDNKIDDQAAFVKWWQENVRRPGQGNNPEPRYFNVDDAEAESGISQQQVSKWSKWLRDPAKYRVRLFGAAWKAAMARVATTNELVQQSFSNEHYTPAKYIEAARAVLVDIDLDPASCEQANLTVKAGKFYSVTDKGLEREWFGRVWLNPPYGGLAGQFVERLADEFENGGIVSGIALVNAHCTDTAWFQRLWEGGPCFTHHRINFGGDDERSGSTHGSVFAYFGPNKAAFINEFSQFGFVVEKARA